MIILSGTKASRQRFKEAINKHSSNKNQKIKYFQNMQIPMILQMHKSIIKIKKGQTFPVQRCPKSEPWWPCHQYSSSWWQTRPLWWTWTPSWTHSWWTSRAGSICPHLNPQLAPAWRGSRTHHQPCTQPCCSLSIPSFTTLASHKFNKVVGETERERERERKDLCVLPFLWWCCATVGGVF